ncbi:nicotinate phosphoribosyltransferase [Nannocystaceae bacterium ST9]
MREPSTGLQTDLYQLTMAQGYWKLGRADQQAVFNLTFRKPPFGAGVALACGLAQAVEFIERFRYEGAQLEFLATLQGNDGGRLFDPRFLAWLGEQKPRIDLDAIPEGSACFPHEPLLRVRGPLAHCQLLETGLLTILNFQTLIATKAARIVAAAGGDAVLEFGLRRAQGLDGGLSASRAAYLGGVAATSNVEAGMRFGIPVRGTHAHAWVMAFEHEQDAFAAYADAMPNNCVFLVDTYDTLTGVDRAIVEAAKLHERGHKMAGIRLDSGDLGELSKAARAKLDAAGLHDAAIVASSDLDEYAIDELKLSGAAISVWGVGTRLATAYDQPALGGVYKLAALQQADGSWRRMVKLSENPIKTSLPGLLQVRRVRVAGTPIADVIYDEELGAPKPGEPGWSLDPAKSDTLALPADATHEDLLVPVLRQGKRVGEPASLEQSRARAREQLADFPGLLRGGHHPVVLEPTLAKLERELIAAARTRSP